MAVTKEGFAKASAYFIKLIKDLKLGKGNVTLYERVFKEMSLADAQVLVDRIKSGSFILPVFVKNMDEEVKGSFEDVIRICEKYDIPLFERIWLTDPITGEEFLTPEKSLILLMPTRRQIHHLIKKMSTPENDKIIDQLSGQVTGDSKGASITFPEYNALDGKGYVASLAELVKIRGGDSEAYKMMIDQLEETGGFSISPILDAGTETESVTTLKYILLGMHLDNNV